MSFRPTYIALLLALITGAAAYALWRSETGAAAGSTAESALLTADAFPAAQINRIELRRGSDQRFVFARDERGWMQIEPFLHPVDEFSLGQLVQLAANLRVGRTLSQDAAKNSTDDASLGLNPPRGVVRYAWDGGDVSLRLGRGSMGGRAYLQVGVDGPVHVVNRDLHDRALDMDPREWRLRRLFTHAGADSSRVRSRQFNRNIELTKERRTWRMTAPVTTRVDEVRIVEFLAEVNRAQHSGFMLDQPDDLAAFGLLDPDAELTVDTSVGEQVITERLIVGAPITSGSSDRYAIIEGRPTVVRLTGDALTRLFPDEGTFISLSVTGIDPSNVKSIRISGPEGEFTLERRVVDAQEVWVSLDHNNQRVPARPVTTLLEMLTQFQATGLLAEPYQAEHEVAVITLFGYDGGPLDAVRIARPNANGDWFFDNGDGLQRLLPPSVDPPVRASHYGLQPLVR